MKSNLQFNPSFNKNVSDYSKFGKTTTSKFNINENDR